MAANATIHKVELQVSDLDRHYYASHSLTLAQHPSETATRLMVRLIAFSLFAHERMEFGRGLGVDEDATLWQRDYGGEIERWIDLGQPDEGRIRKASARARMVAVVTYSGDSADIWWGKLESGLSRLKNLTVIDLTPAEITAATGLLARNMRLTAMIQDGALQLMNDLEHVAITPRVRIAPGC